MMSKKISLKSEQKKKVLKQLESFLRREPDVLFAYVFGSFIKSQRFEDIDLAIYLENSGERKVLRLEREVEELLHLPVEISLLNEAPLSFAFRIVKEGKPIFIRDNKARCDFEGRIRVLYFDFLPFYQRYYKEVVLGQG